MKPLIWDGMTAAEKREAEPDAGKAIRGKRDVDESPDGPLRLPPMSDDEPATSFWARMLSYHVGEEHLATIETHMRRLENELKMRLRLS